MKQAKRGPSNYKRRKSGGADRYGTYLNGKLTSSEYVAGRTIDRQLPSYANNAITAEDV